MAYSYQTAVSDGTLDTLAVSIPYFDRSEISVYFDDVANEYPWSWVGTTEATLAFSPPIPNGVVVQIKRNTDISARRHDFSGGAMFTSESIDENFEQIMRMAQEAKEGGWGEGVDTFKDTLASSAGGTLVGVLYGGETRQLEQVLDEQGTLLDDAEAAIAERIPEIANYAALRAYNGPVTAYYVRGVANTFDGGAGVFRVDAADTTSADNGGTVLVDASGRRWRREFIWAVNVRWFGAKGDGVTDDTAAIQAAIDAAQGKKLVIPDGTYIIYSALTIPSNSHISGASKTGTIIKLVPKSVQTTLSNNFSIFNKSSVVIENLTVDNSAVDDPYVAQTHGGQGIEVEGCSSVLVRNVLIKKALFKAISFGGCTDCYYLDSESRECGYDGWHTWGSQRMWCMNCYFYDCENIEASGYLQAPYAGICDDIHFCNNTLEDMRAGAAHYWGVRRGWFESNKIIYNTRTSTSSKIAFRTSNGGISGRECGTIVSSNNIVINAYRGFQYSGVEVVIENGNFQQAAYDIGFLYGTVSKHVQTDNCFSLDSRNDAYRVETTDNAVVINFGNSAKGPSSDVVTNAACLSIRSGTVIQKNTSLIRGAYARTVWLVSTYTGTFIEGKNNNFQTPIVDATGATVVLQNEFSDFYVQIGSSTDVGQELRFNPNGFLKYFQTGVNAGQFQLDAEAGGSKLFTVKNTGGNMNLRLEGKEIRMQRTDGTYVTLTVNNSNALVIA